MPPDTLPVIGDIDRRQLIGLAAPAALAVAGCMPPQPPHQSFLSLAGLGGTTHQTVATDGLPIVYDEFGDGPVTLVLVHGWACDRRYWAAQISHFNSIYRIIAPDLPGHGGSGDDRDQWSIESLGEDVARVVEAAGGAPRYILVGHSLGGAVVTAAASQMRAPPLGIVTVDIMKQLTRDPTRSAAATVDTSRFRETTEASVRQTMFLPSAAPGMVSAIAQDMASADPESAFAIRSAYGAYDVATGLAALGNTPLMMINNATRPTDVEGIRAIHLRTRFEIIEDSGHFIMIEKPAVFNALLTSAIADFTAT